MTDSPDASAVVAKATPPLAYGVAAVSGMTIEQWISVLTVVYLLFAIITLIFPNWRVACVGLWSAAVQRWQSWRG